MTAKDRLRMKRLEIENRELRAALEHHQDVGRKMFYEVAELKTRLELVGIVLSEGEGAL